MDLLYGYFQGFGILRSLREGPQGVYLRHLGEHNGALGNQGSLSKSVL